MKRAIGNATHRTDLQSICVKHREEDLAKKVQDAAMKYKPLKKRVIACGFEQA
jgi:hypothetical protein